MQLHFHGYPALYNPLETHCDEFTWYRGGLTKNFSPFLQAENKRNTGNCDGISTRYCCEMEEMLNLIFILLGSESKVEEYLNCKNKDLSVINIFTNNIQKHSVYVHLICFSLHESFMIFFNFLTVCDENTTEHSSWSSRSKSSSHQRGGVISHGIIIYNITKLFCCDVTL